MDQSPVKAGYDAGHVHPLDADLAQRVADLVEVLPVSGDPMEAPHFPEQLLPVAFDRAIELRAADVVTRMVGDLAGEADPLVPGEGGNEVRDPLPLAEEHLRRGAVVGFAMGQDLDRLEVHAVEPPRGTAMRARRDAVVGERRVVEKDGLARNVGQQHPGGNRREVGLAKRHAAAVVDQAKRQARRRLGDGTEAHAVADRDGAGVVFAHDVPEHVGENEGIEDRLLLRLDRNDAVLQVLAHLPPGEIDRGVVRVGPGYPLLELLVGDGDDVEIPRLFRRRGTFVGQSAGAGPADGDDLRALRGQAGRATPEDARAPGHNRRRRRRRS